MAEHKVSHPVGDPADADRRTVDAHRLLVMWLFLSTDEEK